MNGDATHCIPLHPLYTNTGLSVDLLYADVVVREDLTSLQRMDFSEPEDRHKIVKNPEDLFLKDGKQVRNVYMLGQPGYGKTTFCLHLLKLWCIAKMTAKASLSLWQQQMLMFEFVFYVTLRHVDRCRSSIVEMICEDVFERDEYKKDVIRHVLRSPEFRCLVVMDGLDEWVYSLEAGAILRQKGLPNTKGLSRNCTILFASRHWKVELIQPKYSKYDMVIEILGLNDKGLNAIIQNILSNFFKLKEDSLVYKTKTRALKTDIKNSESSVKVPMFVTMSVFLGFDGKHVRKSATGLILDQLELLIRRALDSGHIDENVIHGLNLTTGPIIDVPKVIQGNKILSQFTTVFYKLGKIAFNDLISKESRLVFKRDILDEVLGECELDIALKVGIVSQMRTPGRFLIPKLSIEFLHESMQEAMAALYVVSNSPVAFRNLCEYCCTLDKVMKLSNMMRYISGLSQTLGCKLSMHLVHLGTNEKKIVNEMETEKCIDFSNVFSGKAEMLFNMQHKCYKEMTRTLESIGDADMTIDYFVSDVVLGPYDDNDDVDMACKMMHGCNDNVLSFTMCIWKETKWAVRPVLQALQMCSHLTTLHVEFWNTTPDAVLVNVIPTLNQLQHVWYRHYSFAGADRDVDSVIVRAVLKLPRLKYLKLYHVSLNDDVLMLTHDMALLSQIELGWARMSPKSWNRFVSSLINVKQSIDVSVKTCIIDYATVDLICKSEYFTVKPGQKDWHKQPLCTVRFTSSHKH